MPVEKGNNCPACRHLAGENAHLKKLLASHGICWDEVPVESFPSTPVPSPTSSSHQLTTPEKISLFRRLFRGREDVYPRRWESAKISRSGNGAHAWIFFAVPVPARSARQFGAALISYTCSRTRQLSLASYDRLFPNQDSLPKDGFGNLIALPLQKKPREQGRSVFVGELHRT